MATASESDVRIRLGSNVSEISQNKQAEGQKC